ncbi:MAG: hypothetical protein RLZZ292_3229 [Bacteroidota bacterium]|jgi:hypothetical protein
MFHFATKVVYTFLARFTKFEKFSKSLRNLKH